MYLEFCFFLPTVEKFFYPKEFVTLSHYFLIVGQNKNN